MKVVALSMLAVLVGSTTAVRAQCPHQGLAGFGPISAATFGYPAYYVDQTGSALETCLDPANLLCGLPPLPNPNAPIDIATGNFFSEHLYTFVTATVPMPGGGQGLVVFSIVGTFGGPTLAPVPGEQVVFSRVRFRIDTPAAGDYTITHPFGVHVLHAAAAGRRSINFTDDCLLTNPPTCGAASPTGFNAFTTPLDPARYISTFLQWDATPPAPPAGFIGDPARLHTITGSPCGQNFFRVEGPGLPAGGVETSQWSVLGKKAQISGNGILDPIEQCDDGNTVDGDCCSSTCQFEAAGSLCDDGSPCTDATTTCDAAGVCQGGNPVAGPCDDGNGCTTIDSCAGGVCVGGGPPPTCPVGSVLADTMVDSGHTTTKFGAAKLLTVDASPIKRMFYRVNVGGLGTQPLGSATLRLRTVNNATAESPVGGAIHRISNCAWNEATMTYKTGQPAIDGPTLFTAGPAVKNQVVDFPVTSAIPGDGSFCFAIDTPSTNNADYNSREASAALRPQFMVTSSCACTVPGPPTCGDNIVNQPSEQCDGTSSAACPGLCQPTCMCGATPPPPPPLAGVVVADTYVDSSVANTNFNGNVLLFADASATKITFLRANVGVVGAGKTVTSATLRLQVPKVANAQSNSGGSIHTVDCAAWNETTLTFNNRPAISPTILDSKGPVAQGQTVDFNVTSAVPGNGTYCFAIDNASTDGVDYVSLEGSGAHPALLLTVSP